MICDYMKSVPNARVVPDVQVMATSTNWHLLSSMPSAGLGAGVLQLSDAMYTCSGYGDKLSLQLLAETFQSCTPDKWLVMSLFSTNGA